MRAVRFADVQRQLAEWIDNLPLANPLKVSELIHNKLAELPLTDISAVEAVQLLEMLRAPVSFVNVLLQKHLASKGALSIIETDKQITFTMSLLTRFASAYAVLLNLINPNERLENGKPVLAICIHRAMCSLSSVLLIAYQLYRIPPTQIWLRLHKLYLQAEKAGLVSFSLPHASDEPQTIVEAYKICVLLASANPYQLRPLDMFRLYETLLQWSRYTQIKSSDLQHTLILIKLDEDAPPFYQKSQQLLGESPFLRGLDTLPLIEHIMISIKQHGSSLSDQKSILPTHVLQNIANSWSRFTDRLTQRNSDNGNVQVSVGITSTHTHISAEGGFFYVDTYSVDDQVRTLQLIQNPVLPDNNSPAALFEDPWDTTGHGQKGNFKKSVDSYPLFNWQIVNVSANGLCLEVNIQHMVALEAGELIGLEQKSNRSALWRIACIRWVKKIDDYRFHLGVLILAPSALTTTIQLSNGAAKHQYRAFILSSEENISRITSDKGIGPATHTNEYSIVFPALDLVAGEHLTVLFGERSINIKLTEPLCLNNKFYQFKYQVLNDALLNETDETAI